jgi:hypothetical protein
MCIYSLNWRNIGVMAKTKRSQRAPKHPMEVGFRFGRLLVTARPAHCPITAYVLCKCDCGKHIAVAVRSLVFGRQISCGCHKAEKTAIWNAKQKKHARYLYRTPTHSSWQSMLQRCGNPKAFGFHKYGGRGITVCERWKNFDNFLADMGERPSLDLTLDRIDHNGNYEPGNCRWSNDHTQQNNKSSNRRLTLGDRTLTMAQWALELGVHPATIGHRIKVGWPLEKALTEPAKHRNGRPKANHSAPPVL